MILIHDLHQMAHGLGVQLVHHDDGDKGWFSETYRVISTRRGMPVWDYKSTLAHELAHAVFRDRRSGYAYFDQRQEDRADLYAARMLINHDELHHHALWHRNALDPLAKELEVSPHLLETYMRHHPLKLEEESA